MAGKNSATAGRAHVGVQQRRFGLPQQPDLAGVTQRGNHAGERALLGIGKAGGSCAEYCRAGGAVAIEQRRDHNFRQPSVAKNVELRPVGKARIPEAHDQPLPMIHDVEDRTASNYGRFLESAFAITYLDRRIRTPGDRAAQQFRMQCPKV